MNTLISRIYSKEQGPMKTSTTSKAQCPRHRQNTPLLFLSTSTQTAKKINPNSKTSKEILKVPGRYASPFSFTPLKEAGAIAKNLVSHLEEKRVKYDSSVFHIHSGLQTIACLDHVSAEFYFNASTNLLARENKKRFGPIAVRSELLGGACPALVSTGTQHEKSRKLTDEILAMRVDFLPKAFETVSERLFQKWSQAGEVALYDALLEWSSNIVFQWILGIDVPLEQVKNWSSNIVTVETDTLMTQILGKLMMPKCPRKAIQAHRAMEQLVKSSPLFPEYLKMGEKHGVDTQTLTSFLIFLCCFNGTGAPTFSLLYTVAKINTMPKLKQTLQNALQDADTAQILSNALLDNVYFEVMRLNTRPRVFYKKAQSDFEMPAANGKYYQIRKGDLVLIPAPIVHRDPTVFYAPNDFLPERFAHNPALKQKVFGYGTTTKAKNGYGCAAAKTGKTGQAAWIWKMMLSKLLTESSFGFNVQPIFDADTFFNFRPLSIKMTNFSYGSSSTNSTIATTSSNENLELEKLKNEFTIVADKVRKMEVKFNKKQYLLLYAYYKQVFDGDNNQAAPSALKVLDRQKWMAWNKVKGMSSHAAMAAYVSLAKGEKMLTCPFHKNAPKNEPPKTMKPIESQNSTVQILKSGDAEQDTLQTTFAVYGKIPNLSAALKMTLTLTGEDGKAAPIEVVLPTSMNSNPDEIHRFATWSLQVTDVGRPEVVEVAVEAADGEDIGDWYLSKIVVDIEEVGTSFEFLHHATLNIPNSQVLLFEAKGILPQEQSEFLEQAQHVYRQQNQALYHWKYANEGHLPGEADFSDYGDLPIEEQFEEKPFAIGEAEMYGEKEALPATNFDYYLEKVKANDRPVPRVAHSDIWKKDEEFGRLYLQGTHCNFIRKCTELPQDLNLKADFVVESFEKSLAELMDENLLYIADYEILEGVTPPEGKYLAAPIVLLVSNPKAGTLMPVAIQLQRQEMKNPPVFTPEDSAADWLIAKTHVRVADISVHQLSSHFLLTHNVAEAFALAAYRTFSPTHPIYQLLLPHFRHTFAIGIMARTALLNDGGWIDRYGSFGGDVRHEVMEKAFKSTSLRNAMNFTKDLKNRGVTDTESLPNYPYREDGLLIWKAIDKYVRAVVQVYYRSDERVASDDVLQQFLKEFKEKGYQYSDWATEMTSIEELVELLTSIIFTATALHGSMNYLQYETYGFVPFSPSAILTPPPTRKGTTTEKDILKALPDNQTAAIFIFLSQHFEEDTALGQHDVIFSSHPDVRYALLRFRKDLKKVGKVIEARNQNREVPYEVMMPQNIPNSVEL